MYLTAKEFANAIKKDFYEYELETDDLEKRLNAIKVQYEKIAKDLPEFTFEKEFDAINTKFQNVVDNLLKEFYTHLPNNIKAKFEKHFYFTTIDNKSIKAHIRQSSNKSFFGVFINSSLINLLTKIGKLDAALSNPECVVFCNRFPETKPNKEDIKKMRDEQFEYFSTYKMSHGPFIIIEGPEANTHFSRLHIQEQFIFFHEIAHFLNGDLFQDRDDQKLITPFLNLNHQREHLADLLAFALLLRQHSIQGKVDDEQGLFIMSSIIGLFDVMSCLQQGESDSHPHPLDRMNAIIEGYWGVEVADLIEETYSNKYAWDKLRSFPPTLIIDLVLLMPSIDKKFEEAFNKVG
ncbi:MAG: hypothetical protein WC716_06815 [Chitinophagaceae bacterium]|jgi:hypothetical protein